MYISDLSYKLIRAFIHDDETEKLVNSSILDLILSNESKGQKKT